MKEETKAYEVTGIGKIVHDVFEDGLRFIIMRGPASFCAYVGIPIDHPLAGYGYDMLPINAHGGLTFASEGGKQTWPEGYYWYGWDYVHVGDVSVYEHDKRFGSPREGGKDWTIKEIISDSWSALYDFKNLMKLSEAIAKK